MALDLDSLMSMIAKNPRTAGPGQMEIALAQQVGAASPVVASSMLDAAASQRALDEMMNAEAQQMQLNQLQSSYDSSVQQAGQAEMIKQGVELAKSGRLANTTPLLESMGMPVGNEQATLDQILMNKPASEVTKNVAGSLKDSVDAGYLPGSVVDLMQPSSVARGTYDPENTPDFRKEAMKQSNANSRASVMANSTTKYEAMPFEQEDGTIGYKHIPRTITVKGDPDSSPLNTGGKEAPVPKSGETITPETHPSYFKERKDGKHIWKDKNGVEHVYER